MLIIYTFLTCFVFSPLLVDIFLCFSFFSLYPNIIIILESKNVWKKSFKRILCFLFITTKKLFGIRLFFIEIKRFLTQNCFFLLFGTEFEVIDSKRWVDLFQFISTYVSRMQSKNHIHAVYFIHTVYF